MIKLEDHDAEIKALMKLGVKKYKIAEKLGVTYEQLRYYLKKNNLFIYLEDLLVFMVQLDT